MKIFHGSIRKKLIILVLLSTMPAISILLATEFFNRQHATVEAKQEAALLLNGFTEIQRRVTDSTFTLLRTVAFMPEIRDADVEKSRVILSTLLETNPIYTNVILVDINGDVMAAGRNHDNARKLNFADRKQFKEAVALKGFASGEFVVGKSSKKSIFPFGIVVLNEHGTPNGAILIGIDLSLYGKLYERGAYPKDSFFGVCDNKGLRLFRYPFSDKTGIGKPIKSKSFQAASTAGEPGTVVAKSSDGLNRLIAFEPIRLKDEKAPYMYMFMGCGYDQIQSRANTILYRVSTFALLALILALAIAWFVGGTGIAKRMEKLTRVTQRFGQGEENVTSGIDYDDGEVGALARSFDNMVSLLGQRKDERRKAEEALHISHERFLSVLDGIDATVYVSDMKTYEILFMNKFMIETFGRDLTGEKCWEALRNEVGPCEYCTNDQIIDENGKLSKAVIWQDKNPITNRFYVNHDRAIEWTDGRLVRLQFATDITDLKKIESQLLQTQKMESIGTLAGGIAHDFNNILFPIVGHTEMLLDDVPEDSPFRESLNEIYTSSLRARDLVQQILTFSRQEKNELKLMKVQPIIKEALKLIRSTIPTTISIRQNLQADCGAVKADPTQIHQIVMNLATNAFHAMEETGGDLKVHLKEIESGEDDLIAPDMTPGLYACITIADTGKGINQDILNKIFDPFFTTKKTGKGTGLGLSVVHGIIKNMNGEIQVYSEPGKGTEFRVYLPVIKNAFKKQEPLTNAPILGGSERILLVDDEKGILTMEKLALERLGYRVEARTNGVEALEAFKADPDKFNLVITDMAMPNMPGDKLAIALIKIRPDIPILLCTGFSESMTEAKIKFLGIKGLLLKPIIIKDLAKKIRDVLDSI